MGSWVWLLDRPKVQYVQAEDGTSLAYSVFGAGDHTILVAFSGLLTHLERDWDHPGRARFYELLSGFARVILTDRRNMGMSDPGAATGSLDTIAGDLCKVLDVTGTDRASLVSVGAVPMCLALAATKPERVDHVVLHNVIPRYTSTEDWAFGYPPDAVDAFLEDHERHLMAGGLETYVPAGTLSPAEVGLSPGNNIAHLRWAFELDARAYVPQVRQPVLVIATAENDVPRRATRWLVAHLPDAKHVDLEGGQEPYAGGDLPALVGEIEEFLTGRRTARGSERRLAAVVFTDIVDSTRLASDAGPAAWRQLLDRHDELTRRCVERHDGTYIKSTGDGALAMFPLPDAALAAISEMHQTLADAGLPIRAGAHIGTIEQRGADVSGLTVHTAARIADLGDAGDTIASTPVLDGAKTHDWEPLGMVDLKGVDHPWVLHRKRVEH